MLGNAVRQAWQNYINNVTQAWFNITRGNTAALEESVPTVMEGGLLQAAPTTSTRAYSASQSFDDYMLTKDTQDVFPIIHSLIMRYFAADFASEKIRILKDILSLRQLANDQGWYRDRFIEWLSAHDDDRNLAANLVTTQGSLGMAGLLETMQMLQPIYRFQPIYLLPSVVFNYGRLKVGYDGIYVLRRNELDQWGNPGRVLVARNVHATPGNIETLVADHNRRIMHADKWLQWIFTKKIVQELRNPESIPATLTVDACTQAGVEESSYCLYFILHHFGDVVAGNTSIGATITAQNPTDEEITGLMAIHENWNVAPMRLRTSDAVTRTLDFMFSAGADAGAVQRFFRGQHSDLNKYVREIWLNALKYGRVDVIEQLRLPTPSMYHIETTLLWIIRPDTWDYALRRVLPGADAHRRDAIIATWTDEIEAENLDIERKAFGRVQTGPLL